MEYNAGIHDGATVRIFLMGWRKVVVVVDVEAKWCETIFGYGKLQKYHKIPEIFKKYHTPHAEIPHLQICRNTIPLYRRMDRLKD